MFHVSTYRFGKSPLYTHLYVSISSSPCSIHMGPWSINVGWRCPNSLLYSSVVKQEERRRKKRKKKKIPPFPPHQPDSYEPDSRTNPALSYQMANPQVLRPRRSSPSCCPRDFISLFFLKQGYQKGPELKIKLIFC